MTGQKIKDIISSEYYLKGKYVEKVNAAELGLNSGLYFIRLVAGNAQITRQIVCIEN